MKGEIHLLRVEIDRLLKRCQELEKRCTSLQSVQEKKVIKGLPKYVDVDTIDKFISRIEECLNYLDSLREKKNL
ncbi:MAG: hypothetical protein OXB93_04685 [Cytophagales bacterium]|nr:hypothetical protein [Cytophagales bacterium]